MGRTLDQALANLPAARRAKIEARVVEIIAEEKSLQDLRKAMNKTQIAMARKLKVGQDSISRLEHRADMLLSTLGEYVQALGGRLHLVVEFPDRPPVRLPELGAIASRDAARPRKRSTKRAAA
ncbi:MAG: helix-turn-helix domain-containing protein [Dongiaceae bacterium]